jgi:hypothetical protein
MTQQDDLHSTPWDAVAAFLNAAPNSEVRAIMEAQLEEVEALTPKPMWPDAPYHIGMGKIDDYDKWLSTLNEGKREQEIKESHRRYEEHSLNKASGLATRMRRLEYHIELVVPPWVRSASEAVRKYLASTKTIDPTSPEYKSVMAKHDEAMLRVLNQIRKGFHDPMRPKGNT